MSYYTINGRSLDDLVYQSLSLAGDLAPTVPVRDALETLFGPPTLATRMRLSPRTLSLSVDLWPGLVTDRPTLIDAITRRVSGVVEIVRSEAPDRAWYGELVEARAETAAGNLVNPRTFLDLTFRLVDPRRYDLEPQVLALSTTPVAVPVGTGVSAPVIQLFGASTAVVDPEVVLYATSGAELARLTLTGSLGANTWLDIDCGTEWIALVSSGTRTNALAWLVSGTFPLLDGADAGSADTGPYPQLALESASGTPTGVVRWRRSWH